VQTYAKAQSFDLVLADGVIYFNNSMDITPAILTALQARKPAAAPAAKPAAK
jgi:Skp family chaperone for outer membrane proteins